MDDQVMVKMGENGKFWQESVPFLLLLFLLQRKNALADWLDEHNGDHWDEHHVELLVSDDFTWQISQLSESGGPSLVVHIVKITSNLIAR